MTGPAEEEVVGMKVRNVLHAWYLSDTIVAPAKKFYVFGLISNFMIPVIKKLVKKKDYEKMFRNRYYDFFRLKLVCPTMLVDYDRDNPIEDAKKDESPYLRGAMNTLLREFSKNELREGLRLMHPLKLYVFNTLFVEQRVWTTEVCRRLRLPKSTVSETLSGLEDEGYLRKVSPGHYVPRSSFPLRFLRRVVEVFSKFAEDYMSDDVRNVAGVISHDVSEEDVTEVAVAIYRSCTRSWLEGIVEAVPIVCGDKYVTVGEVLQTLWDFNFKRIAKDVKPIAAVSVEEALKEGSTSQVVFIREGEGYRFANAEMLQILPPRTPFNLT